MMIYLKWLISAVLNIPIMLVCYITNPIVILFADKDGELPSFLHYWQTWDNSCNPSDVYKYKQLPSWLLFDWSAHYVEYEGTTTELNKVGCSRWFTRCYNNDFTIIERLQRYVYRVYWLTRNCAYGFGFWWFGRTINLSNVLWYKTEPDVIFAKEMLHDTFTYGDSREIFTIGKYRLEYNIYIGWKMPDGVGIKRCMIALRPMAWKIKKVA